MSSQDLEVVGWLIGIAMFIAVFVAQLRLFSIDQTLKEILSELKRKSAPPPLMPPLKD